MILPPPRFAVPRSLVAVAILAGCVAQPRFEGPMPVRNQHPAQLTVLDMDPASALALPAGTVRARLDAAYSSLFLSGEGNGNRFEMDGEILRTGLKTHLGLGRGLQLDFEIAAAHTSGGFLDDFLIDYHELFQLPDQGRSRARRDVFAIEARRGDATALDVGEETLTLLDLPVGLTWTVLAPGATRPWGLALRGALELPTGNEDRGYGSGEIELAAGLVAELRLASMALTGHAQYTTAGTPEPARRAGLRYGDVTALGAGAEVPLTDGLSFLLQTTWETSTLRALGFGRAADPQWLLWIGGRGRLAPHTTLELALGEDLSGFVAPDITLYAGLEVTFGAADP